MKIQKDYLQYIWFFESFQRANLNKSYAAKYQKRNTIIKCNETPQITQL